jgi:hypothetical protein
LASLRDRYTLRAVRSVFKDEKKLSIAALSQTLPDRLIGADDAVIGHQPLELLAGVFAGQELARTFAPSSSSLRLRLLRGRVSQA